MSRAGIVALGLALNACTHASAVAQEPELGLQARVFEVTPAVAEPAATPDPVALDASDSVDTDGDGIVDVRDACPELPEDFDEDSDGDGCPDLLCTLSRCAITLLEKVYFAYDDSSIDPRSFALLDDVVFALNSFPDRSFEVQGHTDSEGSSEYNRGLSQRRVDSVVAYLVNKGIAPERLRAVAYGEQMPIDTNRTRDGRAHNRRVEFRRTDGECAAP